MPIKIPNLLPATQVLLNENIFVMSEQRAVTQDIRPLKILVFKFSTWQKTCILFTITVHILTQTTPF